MDMRLNAITLALGLASVVGLSGCNDDDTTVSSTTPSETPSTPSDTPSSPAETTKYSVTAIDGYLRNARIWLDLNGNYVLDDGEPNAISGEGGVADLDVTNVDNPEQYPVVVQAISGQTIDEDEPDVTVSDDYMMSAPPGEKDVTPLSTLVHVLIDQNTTDSDDAAAIEAAKQAAIQQVADQLGLDEDEILGDFVESGVDAAAYAAENLVDSNVLPSSPQELQEVAENEDKGTKFFSVTASVNNEIKKKIAEVAGDSDKTFDNVGGATEGVDFSNDDDEDGVPNDLDDFPSDPEESLDSDGDGIGNNADLNDDTVNGEDDIYPDANDAFPTDRSRAGDHDSDGVDSIDDAFPQDPTEWADNDSDGVGDNQDVFDNDPNEWADTDGDGLGDNEADPYPNDTDNDSYSNDVDDFPLDPNESLDTDGDGVGNNADEDDDGDGVSDEFDTDPLDDEVGNTANAIVASYLSQQSTVYVFDGDIEDGYIDIETLTIADNTATISSIAEANSFGELAFELDGDGDVALGPNGWVELDGQYTIDFSDPDNIEAYLINFDFVSYSLDADLTHLDATNVAQYIQDEEIWNEVLDESAVFSTDAYEVSASMTPDYDIYYLYPDYTPWILRSDDGSQDGDDATSLDEIFVQASIGESSDVFYGVMLSGDSEVGAAAVELIDGEGGGDAYYYTLNWNNGVDEPYATRVASATWTGVVEGSVELVEIEVPAEALNIWGDMWQEESNTIFFTVYNGEVVRGEVEQAGLMLEDDDIVVVNQGAKDEILAATDLPLGECFTGNTDDTPTEQQFSSAVAGCGGAIAITAEMMVGNTFERERSDGSTRQLTFFEDGKVNIAKNGAYAYTDDWEVDGNHLVISATGFSWTWALVGSDTDGDEVVWSVKHYEDYTEDGESMQSIWSENYLQIDEAVCAFEEIEFGSATEQGFLNAIADYEECTGTALSITEARVQDLTMTRFKSNGEMRAYDFFINQSSKDIDFYRNGSSHYTGNWRIDDGKVLTVYTPEEITDQFVVLSDSDEVLQVAMFSPLDQEVWRTTFIDTTYQTVSECSISNTEWNDETDLPETTASFDEFLGAVNECKEESGVEAYFSTEYFDRDDRQVEFISDDESYVIKSDGTGSYIDGNGDDSEEYSLVWEVDENDLLVTTITFGGLTAIDYIALVDTNGIALSLKVLSKANEEGWPGIGPGAEGDLWSGVYTSEYVDDVEQ